MVVGKQIFSIYIRKISGRHEISPLQILFEDIFLIDFKISHR
jgi:hypothetical protein